VELVRVGREQSVAGDDSAVFRPFGTCWYVSDATRFAYNPTLSDARIWVLTGAVGAVAMALASARFVTSLRGFPATSHYLRTIIEICKFSSMFLVIMVIFSMGCGWSFMLLFGGFAEYAEEIGIDTDSGMYSRFNGPWMAFVTSYDFMLGNTDIEGWENGYYELIAIPLFIFFSFFVVLVMLNLLIALMADGYTVVMETQSKVCRFIVYGSAFNTAIV